MLNNRKLKKGNKKKRSLFSDSTSESYDPEKEKNEKRLQLIELKIKHIEKLFKK